jgi:hypothetical protein
VASPWAALEWRGAPHPYIRDKFTRNLVHARELAPEYFERYPKDRYEKKVGTWREIQSCNIEFTMKRLREPIPDRTPGFPARN